MMADGCAGAARWVSGVGLRRKKKGEGKMGADQGRGGSALFLVASGGV